MPEKNLNQMEIQCYNCVPSCKNSKINLLYTELSLEMNYYSQPLTSNITVKIIIIYKKFNNIRLIAE